MMIPTFLALILMERKVNSYVCFSGTNFELFYALREEEIFIQVSVFIVKALYIYG